VKIEIEVTEQPQSLSHFNVGWLAYILGMDRPEGAADEDGHPTSAQQGWDTGSAVPEFKRVRSVFTRQDMLDPMYIVREVLPEDHPAHVDPVRKSKVVIGE
jgi:hypothetical protein